MKNFYKFAIAIRNVKLYLPHHTTNEASDDPDGAYADSVMIGPAAQGKGGFQQVELTEVKLN
jgi:hypothetical protein